MATSLKQKHMQTLLPLPEAPTATPEAQEMENEEA